MKKSIAGLTIGAAILGAVGWFVWPAAKEGRRIPVSIVRLVHIAIVLWALFAIGRSLIGEFVAPPPAKSVQVAVQAAEKAQAAEQLSISLSRQAEEAKQRAYDLQQKNLAFEQANAEQHAETDKANEIIRQQRVALTERQLKVDQVAEATPAKKEAEQRNADQAQANQEHAEAQRNKRENDKAFQNNEVAIAAYNARATNTQLYRLSVCQETRQEATCDGWLMSERNGGYNQYLLGQFAPVVQVRLERDYAALTKCRESWVAAGYNPTRLMTPQGFYQ